MKKLLFHIIVFTLIITMFNVKTNVFNSVIAEENIQTEILENENDFNNDKTDGNFQDEINENSNLNKDDITKTNLPVINAVYDGDNAVSGYAEAGSDIVLIIAGIEYYSKANLNGFWKIDLNFNLNLDTLIKVYAKNIDKDMSEEANVIVINRRITQKEATSSTYFESLVGNTLIKVSSDEGVFPGGTTMKASLVTHEVKELVENELNASDYVAFDITFSDENGNEIQPSGNVNVIFENLELDINKKTEVYHIDESKAFEEVTPEIVGGNYKY